jgi:small subunit ribosomal protein S16
MLKIRMQRTGRVNHPSYRIVVIEHTEGPKSSSFVEKVGTYNAKTKEQTLNGERIKYWLSVGAQATGTMHNMLVSAGIIEGKKINVLPRKSPPKKEGEEAAAEAAPAAEAPAAESAKEEAPVAEEAVAEAPAEEVKA